MAHYWQLCCLCVQYLVNDCPYYQASRYVEEILLYSLYSLFTLMFVKVTNFGFQPQWKPALSIRTPWTFSVNYSLVHGLDRYCAKFLLHRHDTRF